MASTPSRRTAQASATSFIDALSRVRAQTSFISSTLANQPTATLNAQELLRELKTLRARLAVLEAAQGRASEVDFGKAPNFKDELDADGTLLWNKSTMLRHAHEEAGDQGAVGRAKEVVAELRRAGYILIRLGTLEPLTPASHLSLLSLATKTALAFLAADKTAVAEELLREAGSYASQLHSEQPSEPAFAAERAKALLAHYCCRIRTTMSTGATAVASWVKDKALALISSDRLPWREIEKLAHTVYDVGNAQLRRNQARPHTELDKDAREAPFEWLQLALELLEHGEGGGVQKMQVAALKALVQAYLDASVLDKAEETLKQLLEIDSSPVPCRRHVKLVLARKGGDGEIVEAFLVAAKSALQAGEDASLLLALLHKIPDERRALRFGVMSRLCDPLDPPVSSQAHNNLLAQLFTTATFFLTDADRVLFEGLARKCQQNFPSYRLPPSVAFLAISYLWRQGDKAQQEKRAAELAEWFMLALNPLFEAVDAVVLAKSARKAALSFIDAGDLTRAEQALQILSASGDYAKTHFVRFYIHMLQKNPTKAKAALQALTTAPDFTPSLLLWAAKIANEANDKDLLADVLQSIVDICGKGGSMDGVDLMVVLRFVLFPVFSLALATALAEGPSTDVSLSKDVCWLYKTGFNLCARFSDKWAASTLVSLYGLTASLIELDIKLGSSIGQDILGKLWVCKFAALSGQAEQARNGDGAVQSLQYKELVGQASAFLAGLHAVLAQGQKVEKANALLDAALSVKIEAQAAVGDWKGLSTLVEDFEDSPRTLPVSLLKLVVDKATASSTCAGAELRAILRKTLVLLYARKDLDVSSMALWLRMIISALISSEPDQALEYVKNAAQLIARDPSGYPTDEIEWLLSTTWDYGLDAYTASEFDVGKKWCSMAGEVAKAANKVDMMRRLETWHGSLKRRYATTTEDVEMTLA
ncbi:hypothetical protein JCM10207_006489 [Rhodosporidiobolus poonsookiae]